MFTLERLAHATTNKVFTGESVRPFAATGLVITVSVRTEDCPPWEHYFLKITETAYKPELSLVVS
jgi:hypothetical protein